MINASFAIFGIILFSAILVYDVALHQNLRSQSFQCQQSMHLNRLLASQTIHNDLLQRLFVLRRLLESDFSVTHECDQPEEIVCAIVQVEQLYGSLVQLADQLSEIDVSKNANSLRS